MGAYERLRSRLVELKWKDAVLCRELNMDTAQFSRAMKNRQGLDGHWPLIADIVKVSLDWLLLGRGSMDLPTPPRDMAAIYQEINASLAAENLRLKAENIALKDLLLAHNPRPAISPQDAMTPLNAGQIESEGGVRVPPAPGSVEIPGERPRRSPRIRGGGA